MAGIKTKTGRLKRVAILGLLRSETQSKGYPPSLADLCRGTNIPRTTVRWHLDSLRDQGLINFKDEALARTLKVTRKGVHAATDDPQSVR